VNLMAFFLEHGVLTEDVKWVGGALLWVKRLRFPVIDSKEWLSLADVLLVMLFLFMAKLDNWLDEKHKRDTYQSNNHNRLHDADLIVEVRGFILARSRHSEAKTHGDHRWNHWWWVSSFHLRIICKPLDDDKQVHEAKENKKQNDLWYEFKNEVDCLLFLDWVQSLHKDA
jgi:hypothetical protein